MVILYNCFSDFLPVLFMLALHGSVQFQRDGYDLPAYDALARILPEYQHIVKTPKAPQQSKGEPKEQKKSKRSLELNRTFEIHSSHER